MNKKHGTKRGRFFADINRVMGYGGQRRWYRTAKLLSPAGGGAALAFDPVELEVEIEGKKQKKIFDLNGSIEIVEPKQDVRGWLVALQHQANRAYEAAKGVGDQKEVLAKVEAELNQWVAAQKKLAEEVTLKLAEIPSRREAEMDRANLRGIQLRGTPTDVDPHLQRQKFQTAGFGGVSDVQYSLICYSDQQLGVDTDDRVTVRKLARLRYLSDKITLWLQYARVKDALALPAGGCQNHRDAAEFSALAAELGQAAHAAKLVGPAMNETNAEEGKNWVPGPMLSSRIYPFIEMDYILAAQFERIPMPGPQYDSPVLGSRLKSRKLLENILDDGGTTGAKITPTYFKTKKFSLVAKMHATGVVVSPPWMQDQVAGSDAVLREIAAGISRAREDWYVNGQLTAALDSALTIADDDIRKMGDGLRYWYSQMKAAGIVTDVDAGAGFEAELLARAIGQGKAYAYPASKNIWLTGTAASAKMLVLKTKQGHNVVLTDSELGAQSAWRVGSIGKAFGRDIIISNEVSEKMTAQGLVDDASARTAIYHINTDAVKAGERMGMIVDYADQARFFEYQECYRAVAREDFTRVYDPTTEPFIQAIVNIDKN